MKIVEVGPRDGLQNEKKHLSLPQKYELIKRLAESGAQHIEVGAFVSPKWVPQMKDSLPLTQKVLRYQKNIFPSVLVPNSKGFHLMLQTGIKHIAVFGACTESFSKKNINCSIKESFKRFEYILKESQKRNIKVRGYLSVAFGCPYEGKVSPQRVLSLFRKLIRLGVYEISLGDTIGIATPKQVRTVIRLIKKEFPPQKIALHFHDTRGTALANVLCGIEEGVKTFDSSIGGLGGCPYAKGASGNLATEDLVYMLHGMGFKTNFNLNKLITTNHWLQKALGHPLPSKVSKAGIPRLKFF